MSDASSAGGGASKAPALRVLACIDLTSGASVVTQRAARLAHQLGAPWEAVYVATPGAA